MNNVRCLTGFKVFPKHGQNIQKLKGKLVFIK